MESAATCVAYDHAQRKVFIGCEDGVIAVERMQTTVKAAPLLCPS